MENSTETTTKQPISIDAANRIAAHLEAAMNDREAPADLRQGLREAVTLLFNDMKTDQDSVSDTFSYIRDVLLAFGENRQAITDAQAVVQNELAAALYVLIHNPKTPAAIKDYVRDYIVSDMACFLDWDKPEIIRAAVTAFDENRTEPTHPDAIQQEFERQNEPAQRKSTAPTAVEKTAARQLIVNLTAVLNYPNLPRRFDYNLKREIVELESKPDYISQRLFDWFKATFPEDTAEIQADIVSEASEKDINKRFARVNERARRAPELQPISFAEAAKLADCLSAILKNELVPESIYNTISDEFCDMHSYVADASEMDEPEFLRDVLLAFSGNSEDVLSGQKSLKIPSTGLFEVDPRLKAIKPLVDQIINYSAEEDLTVNALICLLESISQQKDFERAYFIDAIQSYAFCWTRDFDKMFEAYKANLDCSNHAPEQSESAEQGETYHAAQDKTHSNHKLDPMLGKQ